jgi:hypothetical protein
LFISDPERLYPFRVTVDGVICANVTSGGEYLGQPIADVKCKKPLEGRVVRLHKFGDWYLTVCEVEIYSTCTHCFNLIEWSTDLYYLTEGISFYLVAQADPLLWLRQGSSSNAFSL